MIEVFSIKNVLTVDLKFKTQCVFIKSSCSIKWTICRIAPFRN